MYHQKKIKLYYYSPLSIAFSFSSSIFSMPSEVIQRSSELESEFYNEIEQNLENESCLSVWVDPKNVFEPCPNLKNSQIRAKNFSISLFLC